ncbi:MAG TPA: class I SAM-dependent methyltransferase [Cytophagales bacterium]|nr:class I SAM-dependent methyltransferase [Cytophagales bacterium]HAA23669.1 class I SAM-dependent methyltransferase [Cytophagales bacterium]HAP59255.1 class I SAM-dependent methyltransferase [Cytophagales bacterium]
MLSPEQINRYLGNVDLYLLDQILKGRFNPDMKVLDAGCGEGRNLSYFLRNGYHVEGIDRNEDAIRMIKFVARLTVTNYPEEHFQIGDLLQLPYPGDQFQLVICNAVLHFAESEDEFWQMWKELTRMVAPDGYLFVRTASVLGLDLPVKKQDVGRYWLPDGSLRFLLDRSHWDTILASENWELVEPLKVVSVDEQRGMSTIVLQKKA